MLDVIGAGVESLGSQQQRAVDFVTAFNGSSLRAALERDMEREGFGVPSKAAPMLQFDTKRAATELTQAKLLFQRFFRMYWRTAAYNWTRIAVNIFLGVLFGAVFFDSKFETYQGINGPRGVYRERASQTYSAFWYFAAFTIVEVPYVLVSTFFYSVIFYPMAGFTALDRLLFCSLNTALHVLTQIYLGQFFAFALPSVEVAALVGVLFNSIFVLFMGFNPPASVIPSGYKWLFDVTLPRYVFMFLSGYLLGECESPGQIGCTLISNVPNHPPITVKQYLDSVFGIRYSDIGYYFTINVIMFVSLRLLALLALRFINHQKK